MKLTPLQRRIAREYNMSFEEVMRTLYVDKRMTMQEIANELDVNLRTIQRWLQECGIKARKMQWV